MQSKKNQSGVTLIEVLVTVVVMSVGLLGVAALHTYTLRSNQDALVHSQATVLTQDIADRMRANRQVAVTGAYDLVYGSAATVVTSLQSTKDLSAWRNLLTTQLGPGADGEITRANIAGTTQQLFTIKIRWTEKTTNSLEVFETQAEI